MKIRSCLAGAILVVATSVAASAATVETEAVPMYTSDDLDRMFGPVPAGPSEPVDKTRPEDWRWVEQFIDRQYARVDADRQYDLDRHAQEWTERPQGDWNGYYGPAAWGLGYPASTWWNSVWGRYAGATNGGYRVRATAYRNPYAWATGELVRPQGGGTMPRGGEGNRPGGGHGGGNGHGGGHARRSK